MVEDDPGCYRGVPAEVVSLLGRTVVIAGHLEETAISVAASYGIDGGERLPFHKLVTKIALLVQSWGVPEWARVTADEVTAWCDDARSSMDRRNRAIHATRFFKMVRSEVLGAEPASRNHRSGAETSGDTAPLTDLLADLEKAEAVGFRVEVGLMHELRPNTFLRYRRTPRGERDIIHTTPSAVRVELDEMIDFYQLWALHAHRSWPPADSLAGPNPAL